jgi:nicotinamidase-related amidase
MVMDVQRVVVDRYAGTDYLTGLRRAVDAARAAGLPVIYAAVGFRPGYPEVSPRNKVFGALAGNPAYAQGGGSLEIHPEVAPQPGEIVVTKKRVSAFAGSDLEMVLRAGEIDSLVLTGIATSGVVLSTLRQAADLDFGLTVLADGCLDNDPEVHQVLTGKVFPRQAEVLGIDAWIEGFKKQGD